MLESPCLKTFRQLLLLEVISEGAHPLIYKVGLRLKVLGYSFDALLQPIRQFAPVAPPTHGLVHFIQRLEASGQP